MLCKINMFIIFLFFYSFFIYLFLFCKGNQNILAVHNFVFICWSCYAGHMQRAASQREVHERWQHPFYIYVHLRIQVTFPASALCRMWGRPHSCLLVFYAFS